MKRIVFTVVVEKVCLSPEPFLSPITHARYCALYERCLLQTRSLILSQLADCQWPRFVLYHYRYYVEEHNFVHCIYR